MERSELKAVIEGLLFVSEKPLPLTALQNVLEEVDRRTLLETLDELKAEYDAQGRAFHLVEIAEGYQLVTRVAFAPWIRKLYKHRVGSKLSRAALETLAIIAYRQPISKAEVEDIRGVSADGVLGLLLERRYVRIVGRKEVVGRPLLYGTTKEFLQYFGLKDLTEMPELKDLQEVLAADEAGENWEVNTEGQLVTKVRSGDTTGAAPDAGPAETERPEVSMDPLQSAPMVEEAKAPETADQIAAARRKNLDDYEETGDEFADDPDKEDDEDDDEEDEEDAAADDDAEDEDDDEEDEDDDDDEDDEEDEEDAETEAGESVSEDEEEEDDDEEDEEDGAEGPEGIEEGLDGEDLLDEEDGGDDGAGGHGPASRYN